MLTWIVALRCPDCGDRASVRIAREELEELDRVDEAGEAAIAADLEMVSELRLHHDVDLLIACLRDDAILPEDF